MQRITFIGLGNIGRPMAANLIKAGFAVTVYNRTPERMQALVAQGATAATSMAEAVRGAEAVISMVSDDAAVRAVALGKGGIVESLASGQVYIDMSTVSPDLSREVAAAVEAKGGKFLDAPVSGSVKPATEGTLVILVGGEQSAFDACLPLFQAMGKEIVYLGANGDGTHMKLCINLLLGAVGQAVGECIVLAEKGGLTREQFLQVATAGALSSPLIKMKVPLYQQREYPPAFALKHMAKDYGLAMARAQELGAVLPISNAGNETFIAGMNQGLAEEDFVAVIKVLERLAGG